MKEFFYKKTRDSFAEESFILKTDTTEGHYLHFNPKIFLHQEQGKNIGSEDCREFVG